MTGGPDLSGLATEIGLVGLLAAAVCLVGLAVLSPVAIVALLLVTVLLQDAVTGAGVAAARYADEALLVAALSGMMLRWWMAGLPALRRTPLTGPILAIVGLAAISAAVNRVPPLVAVLGTFAVSKGLLAGELCARAEWSPRARRRAAGVLGGVAVLLALVGLFQRLGGATVFGWTGQTAAYVEWQGAKVPSLLQNHNAFGQLMVLFGLLALGQVWATRPSRRGVWLLAAAAAAIGLVISASREAWLAAGVALVVGAVVLRSAKAMRLALATCLVLAAAGTFVYATSDGLRAEWERRTAGVAAGWHDYDLGFDGRTYRGEYRVYVLRKSGDIWRDHWLLGTGPGRFGGHVATLFPSPVYDDYAFEPQGKTNQQEPLDVFWSRLLAELGLAGTLAYLWAIGAAWGVFGQSRRDEQSGRRDQSDETATTAGRTAWRRGLGLSGAMIVAAIGVLGWFAPVLEEPLIAIPFWALLGLAWSGRNE